MTIVQMTRYGIDTSKADFWVHFHPLHVTGFGNNIAPLEGAAFWYDAELCRRYIQRMNPQVIGGHSKNGSITGAGYLIPKTVYFVHKVIVPQPYIAGIDWAGMTDRECGKLGEDCIKDMIANSVIPIPQRCVERVPISQELEGCDFKLYGKAYRYVEVKTERDISGNLFVQCGERNHNPNLAIEANGEMVERVTPLS